MFKTIIANTIALLIIFSGSIKIVNAQEILGPRFLDSEFINGRVDVFSSIPMAHDSKNKIYIANANEVIVYDPERQSLSAVAGTGEDGTITEGIATEVPMSIQSIAVGPQNQLHILSEGHIGRVDSNDMIELLEFETESGETTNRIPALTINSYVKNFVFNDNGDLFIHLSEGSLVGEVIYKIKEKKLTPYIGGGEISLSEGNSDNPNRFDVRLNNISSIKFKGDILYFSLKGVGVDSPGYFVYKVTTSGSVKLMAQLFKPDFIPITENTLLLLRSLNR